MPETSSEMNNSQTLVIDAEDLRFEVVEQANGQATVISFRLNNPHIRSGDVLLVLSGSEIHFHGLIGKVEDGWATAADRRGSLLPASVQ